MVTMQVVALPLQPPPDQLVKMDAPVGAAVRVTTVLAG